MDVSGIFNDNIVIIYFFICIGIFLRSEMTGNQKMMIVYCGSYAACLLGKTAVFPMFLSVVVLQFLYAEYLSEDTVKIQIIKALRYKILDYLYQFLFGYFTWLFALILTLISHRMRTWSGDFSPVMIVLSLLLMLVLIQCIGARRFQIKSYQELISFFNQYFIQKMPANIDLPIHMLIDMEDKSYLIRQHSYNFLSAEFLNYKIRNMFEGSIRRKSLKDLKNRTVQYLKKTKHIRGYSTLEMQLMRKIGLESGYRYTFQRKMYELFYTAVFLPGLRDYYDLYHYSHLQHFKEYLIWVYFNTVSLWIKGKEYSSIMDAIGCPIQEWELERLFIAILALSGRTVTETTVKRYDWVIEKYQLNRDYLMDLSTRDDICVKCDSFSCSLTLISGKKDKKITWLELRNLFEITYPNWKFRWERYPDHRVKMEVKMKEPLAISEIERSVQKVLLQLQKGQWSFAFG